MYMDKNKQREADAARYYLLKSHGICVSCGRDDASPKRVRCAECLANNVTAAEKSRGGKRKRGAE